MSQGQDKYQKAYEEWEMRIGSAKRQSRNWMLAAIVSLIICLLLIIAIIMEANRQKMYVYVAEVAPDQQVINVQPASVSYTPSVAQKEAFIGDFIKNINDIPLDPVVLNRDWQKALLSVSGQAENQLKLFYQALNPLKLVGDKTVSTMITNANELGDNSFDMTWKVITYNRDGKIESTKLYNGVFTLTKRQEPTTFNQMLLNPLGMKIGFFSFSEKGSSR
ncbi:MAG: VirB8/TrbF family protein [Francisellaceae bacterium]